MKNLPAQIILGLFVVLTFLTQTATAQNASIDWYKVANGGGTSAGGPYTVSGTIAQTDAGIVLSGGNYSLLGGFWSLLSVAESSGNPTLFIDDSGGNIIIHWQAQDNWVLQENPNLGAPSGWTNSFGLVTVNGVSYHGVGNTNAALFFRLKRN